MKLTSKGQVTIPADLRHRHEFEKGDEADIVDDGTIRRIVHVKPGQSRGAQVVNRLRGRGTTTHSTDELMTLLRGQ